MAQPQIDLDEKVAIAVEGLAPEYTRTLHGVLNKDNILSITEYLAAMKTEVNPSRNYRKATIKVVCNCSKHNSNKRFKSMSHKDITSYLDHLRPEHEEDDPLHKWIGTYNLYVTILARFFKWLYYPKLPPKARQKPPVVQNIYHLERKEKSIYKPSDIWLPEDDALFLKYCPEKRISAYHTVGRDTSSRPHEIMKLKNGDIVHRFSPDKKMQYYEIVVNGKTGTIHKVLIHSVPYVKDYLDHEHPMPNNPNAPFICGLGKSLGKHIRVGAIEDAYSNLKKEYFPKLLESQNVPQEDKDKIKELLKKPFNPYIRRHSGLTEKAPKYPGQINQYAGWVEGSKMPQKYLHYFNNQSSNSILQGEGILPKNDQLESMLKPKPCPDCHEPNKPDSKWCVKCRLPLSFEGYQEAISEQKSKDSEIEGMKQELKELREAQVTLAEFFHDGSPKALKLIEDLKKQAAGS
jgi:integrase/recombinase XerD